MLEIFLYFSNEGVIVNDKIIDKLINCIEHGHDIIALKLIKSNPYVDYQSYRNKYNETLIHLCLLPSNWFVSVASMLIDKFDKDNLEVRDNDNQSIFEMAISTSMLPTQLLEKGLNPDIRDKSGYKLISRAAEIGNLELVKIFHEEYNIDLNDDETDSALTLAAMERQDNVVEYLIKADVDLTEHFIGFSAIDYIDLLEMEYKRLDEYVEEFLKYPNLERLVPSSVTDVFLF